MLPSEINNPEPSKIYETMTRHRTFGKENFFIELQNNGIEDQIIANHGLIRIAKELELEMIATNDCHYLNKEDSYAH